MSEQEKQENQKTIVAFAAGLLIGGLLVWIFGGSTHNQKVADKVEDIPQKTEVVQNTDTKGADVKISEVKTEPKKMTVGEGKVVVADQKAGMKAVLVSATFPTDDGWIGVKDYTNGIAGGLLGVARYSKSQGLIPSEVSFVRPTKAGKEYAIVFYKESGDKKFTSGVDMPIDGVFGTFKAQ